jgi:hypothetical protein
MMRMAQQQQRQPILSKHILSCCLLLLLLVLVPATADDDIGLCCLCDGCNVALPGRWKLPIDATGKTCNELVMEMADDGNESKHGTKTCEKLKSRYRDRCCNPTHLPNDIEQVPAPSPISEYSEGPYSSCNLCYDASYPGNEYTPVVLMDPTTSQVIPGVNTCRDLYWF